MRRSRSAPITEGAPTTTEESPTTTEEPIDAFAHGKHVIAMNAEVDATLGPILHLRAKHHGVMFSACAGDEPTLQMNLYRWVRGLGLVPRVIGNVKGLQDPYRNPETQKGFAEQWVRTRRW